MTLVNSPCCVRQSAQNQNLHTAQIKYLHVTQSVITHPKMKPVIIPLSVNMSKSFEESWAVCFIIIIIMQERTFTKRQYEQRQKESHE